MVKAGSLLKAVNHCLLMGLIAQISNCMSAHLLMWGWGHFHLNIDPVTWGQKRDGS